MYLSQHTVFSSQMLTNRLNDRPGTLETGDSGLTIARSLAICSGEGSSVEATARERAPRSETTEDLQSMMRNNTVQLCDGNKKQKTSNDQQRASLGIYRLLLTRPPDRPMTTGPFRCLCGSTNRLDWECGIFPRWRGSGCDWLQCTAASPNAV